MNSRDCPVCYRIGALVGARDGGQLLECGGCAARFRLERGAGVLPDTLERVRADALRILKVDELDRVRGGVA